jgi:hypothetical protein
MVKRGGSGAERFTTGAIKCSLSLRKRRCLKEGGVRSWRWQGDEGGVAGKIEDIHRILGGRLSVMVELLEGHANEGIGRRMVFLTIDGHVVVEVHLECTLRPTKKGECCPGILRIPRKVGGIVNDDEDFRLPKAT